MVRHHCSLFMTQLVQRHSLRVVPRDSWHHVLQYSRDLDAAAHCYTSFCPLSRAFHLLWIRHARCWHLATS